MINALERNLTNDSIPNSEFLSEGAAAVGTSGFIGQEFGIEN
jgi:hypothetical protein